ncbi:unnamed protein product [Caenorhabditis brenneri]
MVQVKVIDNYFQLRNATRTVGEQLSLRKKIEDQSKLLAGYKEQERTWETQKKELKRITKKLRKRAEKIQVTVDASGTKEECLQLLTKMEGVFGIEKWRWDKYWKKVVIPDFQFRWLLNDELRDLRHPRVFGEMALADDQEASTGDSPYWELSKYAVLFTFGIIVARATGSHVDTEKYAKLFFAGFFVLSVIVICYFHGYGINIDDKIILILIGCLGLGATAFNQYDLRCKMIPVAPRPVAV